MNPGTPANSTVNTTSGSSSTQPSPVTLTGTPPASVTAGTAYAFQPTVSTAGGTLTLSITGQPVWASFNGTTGELSGTPPLSDVGTTAPITITASNGSSNSSIGPFTIAINAPAAPPPVTGSATLTWVPPTQNTDGTAVSDLAGYYIYYGTSAAAMTQTIDVVGGTTTTFVVSGLAAGTYYFTVTAYTTTGTQSAPSNVGSKTI